MQKEEEAEKEMKEGEKETKAHQALPLLLHQVKVTRKEKMVANMKTMMVLLIVVAVVVVVVVVQH